MRVLSAEDLVPDEPLGSRTGKIGDNDDLLHHRVLAQRTAELATSSSGNVNVALFGPWGAGKSSFNALLREELSRHASKPQHITFDAWKNAGSGFRTNFLSEVAEQLNVDVKISEKLFQSTSSVRGPLADLQWSMRRRVITLVIFLAVIFLGLPALWSLLQLLSGVEREFLSLFFENVVGFASMAASGTLVVVVALAVIELSKVTVSKSTPSHVAQFGKLFQEILDTKKKRRFVIFIDELDRCTPDDVMATLEGLRTFLGHPRCVFVVAFDREAVAGIIAAKLGASATRENAAPYYRTSGEYIDKIFQFQLALPPQPVHTFRRFASSLVRDRGGVWLQLRAQNPDLLDRIVNILSPMHLASPRRTKVLLNDFAINARVYEGMGFQWIERAEEIAVLTVLQTEFPRLAADLEREPALMRFLYREEIPSRESLHKLVQQYSEEGITGEPLDQVVGNKRDEVAGQLEENLHRYLRLLRERNVPEPRADLIMMHSDGSLFAFDDPGVYHELLSAADMPRQDVLEALSGASTRDLAGAIRYLLDQTEKESKEVADRLIVMVGEIAGELQTIEPDLARLMSGRVSTSVERMTLRSLQGYAVALAGAYQETGLKAILDVAGDQLGADVIAVVDSLTRSLNDDAWMTATGRLLPIVLEHAKTEPKVAADFFVRFSRDPEAQLSWDQIRALAADLSADPPEPVEPASTTTAAKVAAEEQDAENAKAHEAQRAEYRRIAEELTSGWDGLALGSEVRRDILRVLRRADSNRGFLDQHDSLIDLDIERGQVGEANALLLDAIRERPQLASQHWAGKLQSAASVDGWLKRDALEKTLELVAQQTNETVRERGARVAHQIAGIPSDEFDRTQIDDLLRDALESNWDEYSDSRFETHLQLIAVMESLDGDLPASDDGDQTSADDARVKLYATATVSAQAEAASVAALVSAIESEGPTLASRVATEIASGEPWNRASPELPVRVILAAQHRALADSIAITHLPPEALTQISDVKLGRNLVALWVSTAPSVADLRQVPAAVSLNQAIWRRFGAYSTEAQRAEAWNFLERQGATYDQLRALSEPGQSLQIYEETAKIVREAKTVPPRDRAVKAFLTLPVRRDAADEVRAMVKVMAQDAKRTELALGVLLLRAYTGVLSATAVKALQPLVSKWAEDGEGLVAKRDLTWLVEHGFATKKSPLWNITRAFGRG